MISFQPFDNYDFLRVITCVTTWCVIPCVCRYWEEVLKTDPMLVLDPNDIVQLWSDQNVLRTASKKHYNIAV